MVSNQQHSLIHYEYGMIECNYKASWVLFSTTTNSKLPVIRHYFSFCTSQFYGKYASSLLAFSFVIVLTSVIIIKRFDAIFQMIDVRTANYNYIFLGLILF